MTSLSTSTPSQSKMARSKATLSGFVVVKRNAIQLEPVIDQFIAELAGDFGLQLFDLLGGELDHLAIPQIDQVVVMAVAHLLIAGAALAKVMPFDDAGILEQFHG